MPNITLSISESVYDDMKLFQEVKWSEVARNAIKNKISILNIANELAKKSKLTESDIKDFSSMIKKSANKRFLE